MRTSSNYALECAKEFTVTAIENNLIHLGDSPKEYAKNVSEFFHAVSNSLAQDDAE